MDEPTKWCPDIPEDASEEEAMALYMQGEECEVEYEEQEIKAYIAQAFIKAAKEKGTLGSGTWKRRLSESFAKVAGMSPDVIKKHLGKTQKPAPCLGVETLAKSLKEGGGTERARKEFEDRSARYGLVFCEEAPAEEGKTFREVLKERARKRIYEKIGGEK